MVDYKLAKVTDLIEDAKGNKGKTKFLKAKANEKVKDKDGKEVAISFVALKRAYYMEFYKELVPVATKKPSMIDLINEL